MASPSPVSSMARRGPSFPVAWVAISSSHLHPTSPCPDPSCMPTSACLRRMANCSKLPLPLWWDSAPSSYRAQVKQCFRRETNTSLIQQVFGHQAYLAHPWGWWTQAVQHRDGMVNRKGKRHFRLSTQPQGKFGVSFIHSTNIKCIFSIRHRANQWG